jgi:DNA topoisomerase I
MPYTLIITEKPSAAAKIAYALSEGGMKKAPGKGGVTYYRLNRGGKELVVAPAVGHLYALFEKKSSGTWRYPSFDVEWRPTYLNRGSYWAKKYFENMESLAKKAGAFISATDYDREGSVIAYNILRFICGAKDGKRMKFSTLTGPELIEAYEKASEHLDFPQIEAGLARHVLDWLWGINTSRALTLALRAAGGYEVLSTGRVQGPTLKILEAREKEIRAFKPEPYWELELDGSLNGEGITALHERGKFWKKKEAEEAFQRCDGRPATAENVQKEEYQQYPPVPFDLTTLQREAYNNFKFSPKQTLDYAQALYEKALISYPRTSSQKLPPKIGYRKIIEQLGSQPGYRGSCEKLLVKSRLWPREGKKEDPAHPAIYPTGSKPVGATEQQRKVYDLIVKRFLAAFADPAVRESLKITILAGPERFMAEGVRTLQANWMDFYKPYCRFKEMILPEAKKGDAVVVKEMRILGKETQPPKRFTQATILKEMEKLNLGTKCLTGDCEIISPALEEICLDRMWGESKPLCFDKDTEIRKLSTPNAVSFNQNSGSVEFMKPQLISRRRLKKNEALLKLRVKGGELKLTEDHLVYLYDKKMVLKRAKDIVKGDNIVSIIFRNGEGEILVEEDFFLRGPFKLYNGMYMHKFSSKNSLGIKKEKLPLRWSSDLAWILGYFYGDGSYTPPCYSGSHQVCFITTGQKALKLLKTRIKRIFGVEPKAYLVKNSKYKVQCNLCVASLLAKVFPSINGKKRFQIPKEFIGDFLRGFFDADGNVHLRSVGNVVIKGNKVVGHGVPRVKITLARRNHIGWIKDLLDSLGIKTNVNEGTAKLGRKRFKCYTILIGGRDKLDRFAHKIGFDVKHKKRILYDGLLSDSPKYRKLLVCYDLAILLERRVLDVHQIKNITGFNSHEIKHAIRYLVKLGIIERERLSPHSNPPNRAVYKLKDKDYFMHALKASYEHIEGELYCSRVLSTEAIRPANPYVYDISVSEDSPNFITNGGLLVHNSTRAGILQTLYDRGYIREKTIEVTDLGESVVEALDKNCPEIVSAELTNKFERGMEEIRRGKIKSETVIAEAKQTLESILSDFKRKERGIGQELIKGMKKFVKEQNTIGNCVCGGSLEVKHSRAGKRFVGCSSYPKCTETFSLPHSGSIIILKKECEKCGLHVVSVKRAGKRPWLLCVRCGFVNKIKSKAPAKPKTAR